MRFSLSDSQAVPPAPGRGDEAPAPAQGVPAAPPGGPSGGSSNPMGSPWFLFIVFLPVILLTLFSNRSQQKKQKELEAKLKTGDQVLTQSGLVGKLVEKGERYVKVELAPGVKVRMLRSSVVGLDAGEEAPPKQATKALGQDETPLRWQRTTSNTPSPGSPCSSRCSRSCASSGAPRGR